jgi:hypothetical protein
MKISKVLIAIEKLFFNDINNGKKQEKLKEKLMKKIEQTKKEIKNSSKDEEIKDLKEKLYILKRLLERV